MTQVAFRRVEEAKAQGIKKTCLRSCSQQTTKADSARVWLVSNPHTPHHRWWFQRLLFWVANDRLPLLTVSPPLSQLEPSLSLDSLHLGAPSHPSATVFTLLFVPEFSFDPQLLWSSTAMLHTSFEKGKTVNLAGSGDQTISVATTQLCPCSVFSSVTDNSWMREHGSVQLYFHELLFTHSPVLEECWGLPIWADFHLILLSMGQKTRLCGKACVWKEPKDVWPLRPSCLKS